MLSGRHNVATVPEANTHIRPQTSTLFLWAQGPYRETGFVTWETLDRARRLLGGHLSTCPEGWLPGISSTVIGTDPLAF